MVTIKGIIGEEKNQYGLVNLIADVQKEATDKPLHILIDSPGGLAQIAFDMHNYLRSLKRFIITECQSQCYSAAVTLFLSGDRRIAGCPLMIHNPYVKIEGSAEDFARASKDMEAMEKKFTKFYSEHTKIDENTLKALMNNETYITPQKSVEIGFATEAKSQAIALLKNNINQKNLKTMVKDEKSFFKDLFAFVKNYANENKVKALELATTTDVVLIVDREEGEPQVGDVATPDGEHTLPDGRVIVVVDGVITEIRPATETEVEALKKKIEALETENQSLKATAKTNDEKNILNAVKIAGGEHWLEKVCSHYKVQARVNNYGTGNGNGLSAKSTERLVEARKKAGKS